MLDADQTRAVDRLHVTQANIMRLQRKLERAELDRARAVVEARAAGMTTQEVGRVLGVSHVRVVHLTKLAETGRPGRHERQRRAGPRGSRLDPSATAGARPDPSATRRGAPEPTPVGVLLARVLEAPEDPPDDVVAGLVRASPVAAQPDPSADECAQFGCAEPDPSADECRRLGCRLPAAPGLIFCETHARY